jgi:hypothetical protein
MPATACKHERRGGEVGAVPVVDLRPLTHEVAHDVPVAEMPSHIQRSMSRAATCVKKRTVRRDAGLYQARSPLCTSRSRSSIDLQGA